MRSLQLIAEIDEAELTLRMMEAVLGLKRPPGKDTADALEHIRGLDPSADAMVTQMHGASRAALKYVSECIAKSQRVS